MKKNTKLLLGAGAALGIGYLLLRKKDDGKVAGLGAVGDGFTPAELAEFSEFDSYYSFEASAKADYGDVLASIAARRGGTVSESQQDAAYAAAVASGMNPKGCGSFSTRCATDALILSYYGPYILGSLAALGLAGSSSGGSSSGESSSGESSSGGSSSGETGSGSGGSTTAKCGGKYHTRNLGDTCGAHCECDGTMLCVNGRCSNAGAGSGGSGAGGTVTPGDKKDIENTEKPPALKPPKTDDSGIGIGTIALALAAGGVVWFLLRTDDTKVVKLRADAAGAASKKLADYQRRMQNGSGVNGLRRRRKSRR